jgi:hypothetical protein
MLAADSGTGGILMQKTRRIGAVVALATAAFGMAATVAAAPATAAPKDVQQRNVWCC